MTKAHLAPTLQGREEAAPRPASPQPLPHARGRSATSCWLRFSVCLGVRSLLGRSCRKRLVSMGTALGVGERGTKTDRAHSYPTAELRATQEEAAKQP